MVVVVKREVREKIEPRMIFYWRKCLECQFWWTACQEPVQLHQRLEGQIKWKKHKKSWPFPKLIFCHQWSLLDWTRMIKALFRVPRPHRVILIQKILFLQLLHGFKLFHLVSDFQNRFCFWCTTEFWFRHPKCHFWYPRKRPKWVILGVFGYSGGTIWNHVEIKIPNFVKIRITLLMWVGMWCACMASSLRVNMRYE